MLKANVSKNFEIISGAVLSLAGGFLIAGAEINGMTSFIGASVCGAASPLNSTAILVGSLFRHIISGNIHKNIIIIFENTWFLSILLI